MIYTSKHTGRKLGGFGVFVFEVFGFCEFSRLLWLGGFRVF